MGTNSQLWTLGAKKGCHTHQTKEYPSDNRANKAYIFAAEACIDGAKVKTALDEAGIETPFPYRTLTFDEPLQLVMPEKAQSVAVDRPFVCAFVA